MSKQSVNKSIIVGNKTLRMCNAFEFVCFSSMGYEEITRRVKAYYIKRLIEALREVKK